jgi:SAM-dependent methyltransferase
MEKFDASAKSYDETFTHSSIGKAQRARVYHWLKKVDFFKKQRKVFELNCGTGEDAQYFHQRGLEVVATDASPKMVEQSKQKAKSQYQVYQLDLKHISEDKEAQGSDAVFSNFGGLNCLNPEELEQFFSDLSKLQSKGNLSAFVLMSKVCFMEDLYHFFTFRWSKLFRRNTSRPLAVNVDGERVMTYYYTPKEIREMLGEKYSLEIQKPIAFFLPPSYLEPFFVKHNWILKVLNNLEGIFGALNFLSKYSDHYIIVAKRK